jgi:hypothetical protein
MDYDEIDEYEDEYSDSDDFDDDCNWVCKFCGDTGMQGDCPCFECGYYEMELAPIKPSIRQRLSLWAWNNRTLNRLSLRWYWDWKPWILRHTVWRFHKCEMEDCTTTGTYDEHYCEAHYIPF